MLMPRNGLLIHEVSNAYVCYNCRTRLQSQNNSRTFDNISYRSNSSEYYALRSQPSKLPSTFLQRKRNGGSTSASGDAWTRANAKVGKSVGVEGETRRGKEARPGKRHWLDSPTSIKSKSFDNTQHEANLCWPNDWRPVRHATVPLQSQSHSRSTVHRTGVFRVPARFLKERSSHFDAHTRLYHSSPLSNQQAAAAATEETIPQFTTPGATSGIHKNHQVDIRARLREWQEIHGDETSRELQMHDDVVTEDEPTNIFSRLAEAHSIARITENSRENNHEAFNRFESSSKDGLDGHTDIHPRHVGMGDLVEVDFLRTERENVLAVFVRLVENGQAQLFTLHGRWLHANPLSIQWRVPNWVKPDLIEPLLDHLPSPEDVLKPEELMNEAYVGDLSVPRDVAAPVVARLVKFHAESQGIYRQNANALDNAHDLLAHETDLRYGSLTSAAKTLLNIPADKLTPAALYAVRNAISHGGYAFNIDRRSHRVTGYMQIRSKEQVRLVDRVRNWLRHWQDDLAITASMDEQALTKHVPTRGAQFVYDFIRKAKTIVLNSRKTRDYTDSGNIGPSKAMIPISPDQDSISFTTREEFTHEEQDIVRFMEGWSCSHMFLNLPRLESLPPLVLQATGLYPDIALGQPTGYQFMQELGTIKPYENRIKFDQHLLIPASFQSKPLAALMTTLSDSNKIPAFHDTMADLRHDWGNMPVYCIDDADAHEIDDGISLEKCGVDSNGRQQYWVHIHIANPTAFFSRDHPMAKMARHMAETIYMPDRTYMMMPRWATQRHFSLGNDRPCMTFSAKMDEDGIVLEHKVTNGMIRNVKRLTSNEVESLLGVDRVYNSPEIVLTVGGDPPPFKPPKSMAGTITPAEVTELRTLQKLAEGRMSFRKSAGGIFFDFHRPKVQVWQSFNRPGLSWDAPSWRKGSRTVLGDPVIQMRTRGLVNWFAPSNNVVDVIVREMMLLACEISAKWCAERQIPTIYRGTVKIAGRRDPDEYYRDVVAPTRSNSGEIPMHLGIQYIKCLGATVLNTVPMPHTFLGMDYYSKATSPLRRYGDMILHWQIEAALRHEASSRQSLITDSPTADRSFLPFSAAALRTIATGLQPRESIITRSKFGSEVFWMTMLLFRKHHFPNEPSSRGPSAGVATNPDGSTGPLPFDTFQAFVHTDPLRAGTMYDTLGVIMKELNLEVHMQRPEKCGLEPSRIGDVWETELVHVDVYSSRAVLKPLRLLERPS